MSDRVNEAAVGERRHPQWYAGFEAGLLAAFDDVHAIDKAERATAAVDVDLLAGLIKRVTYGGGETLGNAWHDADEIAAEYARLSGKSE